MLFKGFINCLLQYGYDLPVHTQMPSGVNNGFQQNSPYEPFWGNRNLRVFGSGNNATGFSNQIVQCCVIVARPGGWTQILKNADAANINTNLYGTTGTAGPNLLLAQVNTVGPNLGAIELYAPNAPGIYDPLYRIISADGSNGAVWNMGPYLVPNSLNVGTDAFPVNGYKLIPCMNCSNSTVRGLSLPKHWSHYAEGSLNTGAGLFCNAVDFASKTNYILIRGTNTGGTKVLTCPITPAGTTPAAVLNAITMPAFPAITAAMIDNCTGFSWHGGFIMVLDTAGAGPTGQVYEIAIMDAACTQYSLVKFVPTDAKAQAMLAETANNPSWQFVIDKFGVGYLWSNPSAGLNINRIFTSFLPMGFGLPQITYVPRASVKLPCYQTCYEVNPQI